MAIVKPFKAIRPTEDKAEKIIALPYDVMNVEEAKVMAEGNPYSFLHISRSEIDLPEEKNVYSDTVYKKAKTNLEDFLVKEIFLEEDKECYYVYRQVMNGNVQTGIVACISIDDYTNNVVKKHEFTRVEKEIDRTNHFDMVDAQTEPIFLTYKDQNAIKEIINKYADENKPLYDILLEDGISHTLWKISNDSIIEEISSLFLKEDLYIADGHHRTASIYNVCKQRRETMGDKTTGSEGFNFFMAAIFPDTDLKIFDYNRVVKDTNGLSTSEFIEKIKAAGFQVNKVSSPYKPAQKRHFGMLVDNQWYELIADEKLVPDNPVDSLDVSLLQDNILEPILNITDPRTDKRIDFVGGIRGLKGLENRVNKDMKIAFSTFAVDIKDLISVSDNDMIMPPKSTWFEPKMGSGLFVHSLK